MRLNPRLQGIADKKRRKSQNSPSREFSKKTTKKFSIKQEILKYREDVIIVEGKKDVAALSALGFEKVYAIHKDSVSLRERIEQIASLIGKKEKVCILTDLDKKGEQYYLLIKPIIQEHGFPIESGFRGLLSQAQISHVEGIYTFLQKVEGLS